MSGLHLDDPVDQVSGVGPVRARQLAEAGIDTVEQLLFRLPVRYEDRRRRTALADLRAGEAACLVVKVVACRLIRGYGRRSRVEARVEDDTGSLAVVWFNQPYIADRVPRGTRVMLCGRPAERQDRMQLVNPVCSVLREDGDESESLHLGRVVPIYRRIGELGTGMLRRLTGAALACLQQPIETLPTGVRRELDLIALGTALREAHQPPDEIDHAKLEGGRSPAHRRLAMQELLEFQTALRLQRARAAAEPGLAHRLSGARCAAIEACLPFALTDAQRRCLDTVYTELRAPASMHRLIQGDVGSGKTAVAACALMAVAAGGQQGALLAPTEILASQHASTIGEWGDSAGIRVVLLTGTTPAAERRELLAALAGAEPLVVVGTHALLQPRVRFGRLGLAVVDEQHRFGVGQRARLRQQGRARGHHPDLLVVTATPIPRSLALTLYGDLDLERIDEMPPGRQPVATRLLPADRWGQAQEQIAATVKRGEKVFVVVPRIEAALELRSVQEVHQQLRRALPGVGVEILHGTQSAPQKAASMAAFADGTAAVLVATTVVEVGVDVPAATLMVIEHAERFGLAQLHQLRGRVGRGGESSECLLVVHDPTTAVAQARLESIVATTDGFRLAEDDLRLRGPGELLGERQTGSLGLRVADPFAHPDWVVEAHRVAERLASSSDSEVVAFRERLRETWRTRLRMAGAG